MAGWVGGDLAGRPPRRPPPIRPNLPCPRPTLEPTFDTRSPTHSPLEIFPPISLPLSQLRASVAARRAAVCGLPPSAAPILSYLSRPTLDAHALSLSPYATPRRGMRESAWWRGGLAERDLPFCLCPLSLLRPGPPVSDLSGPLALQVGCGGAKAGLREACGGRRCGEAEVKAEGRW